MSSRAAPHSSSGRDGVVSASPIRTRSAREKYAAIRSGSCACAHVNAWRCHSSRPPARVTAASASGCAATPLSRARPRRIASVNVSRSTSLTSKGLLSATAAASAARSMSFPPGGGGRPSVLESAYGERGKPDVQSEHRPRGVPAARHADQTLGPAPGAHDADVTDQVVEPEVVTHRRVPRQQLGPAGVAKMRSVGDRGQGAGQERIAGLLQRFGDAAAPWRRHAPT